jgi:hypothetical protein
MIISLYAGGMTIRDIQAHLERSLGTQLSPRDDRRTILRGHVASVQDHGTACLPQGAENRRLRSGDARRGDEEVPPHRPLKLGKVALHHLVPLVDLLIVDDAKGAALLDEL